MLARPPVTKTTQFPGGKLLLELLMLLLLLVFWPARAEQLTRWFFFFFLLLFSQCRSYRGGREMTCTGTKSGESSCSILER